MTRLIDANEITYYTDEQGFECAYKVDIDNLPTIAPESLRPVAHWECLGEAEALRCGSKYAASYCSLCRGRAKIRSSFCPHCGAKMEDREE